MTGPVVSKWHSIGLIVPIILVLMAVPLTNGSVPIQSSDVSTQLNTPGTPTHSTPLSTKPKTHYSLTPLQSSPNSQNITLITGTRIKVYNHSDTLSYEVLAGDPVTHVTVGSDNYLIPTGTNLTRYDRSLFHVEQLLELQSNTSGIPVFLTTDDPAVVMNETTSMNSRYYDSAGVVATTIDPTTDSSISENDAITSISLDRTVARNSPVNTSVSSTEPALFDNELSGQGVTIAVLDTGIDETHPALEPNIKDYINFATSPDSPTNTTRDTHGHGTAVAGIAAGTQISNDDIRMRGVAPNASILDIQVMNHHGTGSASTVIHGIEHTVRNTEADIILLSVSFPLDTNEPLAETVKWATDQGVVVVAAAGNTGTPRSINAAGNPPSVITVGATRSNGSPAPYSSRGPTRAGDLKPEIVAPGQGITAPRSGNSHRLAIDANQRYTRISGTSAATPHVAGIAALLLESNPALTTKQIENRLATTARPHPTIDAYTQGGGEIDIQRALHPDITVDNANLDFGLIENDTTITRTLTITNHETVTRSLFFSPHVQNVDTNQPAPNVIQLNRSTISLGPNEQTTLNVTINTTTAPGAYSGIISYRVAGEPRSITIGFMRGATVTVEKQPFHERDTVDGDDLWILTEEGTHDQLLEFTNSTAQFTAGGGTYILWSSGTDETTGTTIIHSERHTFRSPTHLVLDEQKTIPVGFDASQIEDRYGPLRNLSLSVSMSTDYADGTARLAESKQRTNSRNIRVSPDPDLDLAVTYLLAPTPHGSATLDVRDVFHIAYGMEGVTATQPVTVPPSSLTTSTHHYYRQTVDETYRVHDQALLPDIWQSHPVRWFDLGDRITQRIHRLPNAASYSRTYDGGTWRAITPNDQPTDQPSTVLSQPFFGQILPVQFIDNTTTITGIPFSDGTGTRFTPGGSQSLTVANDTQSFTTTALADGEITSPALTLNPNETLHIELQGNNSHGYLSTHTLTEITINNYSPRGATDPIVTNQPPIITNIAITNTTPTNAISPGKHRIAIDVDHLQTIQNPTFWYTTQSSLDRPWENSSGWKRTELSRFNQQLQSAITIPEDASTLTIATQLQTKEKHTTRTMITDAAHIGSAPNTSTAVIRGQILEPDRDPVVNDTIIIQPATGGTLEFARTNDTGWFEHELPRDRDYTLMYFRGAPWTPREPGANNLPAWSPLNKHTLTNDTTLDPTTLPTGNQLTIDVTDERGKPVPDATIHVTAPRPDNPITETLTTTQNGHATRTTHSSPGIHLHGPLQITVEPPDTDLYQPQEHRMNLTLTEPQHLTIELSTNPPDASLIAYGTFELGDPVFLDATRSSIPASAKEYQWDLNNSGTPDIITTDPYVIFEPETLTSRPTLTVVDTANKTDTATVTITLEY